ncbi:MAG: hypothetical protein ACRBDX_09880 [Gammaproteobacteria bacterium]
MLLDTHISMPSQDPLAENKFSLLPRDLRKWIKNLPYVDQDLALQQFYDGLKRSNRQAHATKQRLAAIEIMCPVAHDFLISQRKYLLSQTFPLSKKATEVLKLQQNILNELAVAYKIIIQETVNRDSRLNNKKLVTCVHHAMHYQLEQYITLAQVYSEPPQSFWQDLCQMYGIAEHFELTGLLIKNEIDPSLPKSSPKSLFIHACLLSLSNLHTYGHGEAGKIANHLNKLGHLVHLSDDLPKKSECTFYINLALREPVRLMHTNEISISSKNRYIDATALVKELKETENSQNSDEQESNYSPQVITKSLSKRLLKKLTSKPNRASKRAVPAKGRLHLVIGMHNVIEILQTGHTVIEKVSKSDIDKANLELMPIQNSKTSTFYNDNHNDDEPGYMVSSSDAWDWISRGNVVSEQSKNVVAETTPKQTDNIDKVNLNPVVQTWDISNASKGGYCLSSCNTSDYQSQVGDIVLIRLEDKQHDDWRLGVIRWMQSLSSQGVKMGIETVKGTVDVMEVIEAQQTSERSAEVEYILQTTEKTPNGCNKTIITPPNAAANGDCFVLSKDNSRQAVSCQQLLEKTIAFAQFSYTEMPALPNGEHN